MKFTSLIFSSLFLSLAPTVHAKDTATRLEDFAGEVAVPKLNTTLLLNGGAPENEELKRFLTTPPANPNSLAGKRIAVLSTDGVEEIELTGPLKLLRERGAKVDLVAPRLTALPKKFGVEYPSQRNTHILTVRFFEIASWVKIDRFVDEVSPQDYDAVVIPGGAWNPDSLRNDPKVLEFVKAVNDAGKVMAAICHGPLVFVNAGIIKGKKATAYWNVQTDIKNAGAEVLDQPVVVDGKFITSRFPFDIPQFIQAIEQSLTDK